MNDPCLGVYYSAAAYPFDSLWILSPLHRNPGGSDVDLVEIICREHKIHRAKVLLQSMHPGCSRNRHDPGSLGQQPGQCYLRRGCLFLCGNAREQIDQDIVLRNQLRPRMRKPEACTCFS
jgi:hypothetical protein